MCPRPVVYEPKCPFGEDKFTINSFSSWRDTWSMQTGWIDVEAVYEVPSFEDVVTAFAGFVGADGLVAESVGAVFEGDVEAASPEGVAPPDLSDLSDLSGWSDLSEPEDSVEAPSAEAGLAELPERLSVL
jgi:hypothetical protein